MFNWFLRLFGFSKPPVLDTEIVTETASLPPKMSDTPARKNVERKKYYRRNGNFYSREDDSLIEDLLVVAILVEMFNNADYIPQNGEWREPFATDNADEIDAVVERERKEIDIPEQSEPSQTAKLTPDYSSTSSSYDNDSSDSSSDYDSD